MSLLSAGNKLLNKTRGPARGVTFRIRRGTTTTDPIEGSSPPPGHEFLLAGETITLSQHDRVFFYEATLSPLGEPQLIDVFIDQTDLSEWQVVNDPGGNAWNYHGSDRSAYRVFTKRIQQGP